MAALMQQFAVTTSGVKSRWRCVVRWRYTWEDGYLRGVDVMRVRNGKVSEKLSYVKE